MPKWPGQSKLGVEVDLKTLLLSLFLAGVGMVGCVTVYAAADPSVAADAGDDDAAAKASDAADEAALVDGSATSPDDSGKVDVDAQADADADAAVTACSQVPVAGGAVFLGEFATWSGKVNVHRAVGSSWSVDTDCSSGANINTVTYCRKFWPLAIALVALPDPSSDLKPFTAGGGVATTCGGLYPSPGQVQFVCCGPP